MDFLFVPGDSTDEALGRTVISQRPNTTLITQRAAQNHVAGFLARLGAGGSITPPIGDILLVAHGLEFGVYYIPLSRDSPSPSDFEKATAADTANAVRIAAALVTPSGGGAMNTITVRLRGCNIGKARPFVEKLQKAQTPSGGILKLTAPLHFDEFHHIKGGHVEYLAHKFTLKVPTPFKDSHGRDDRPALLAAFAANPDFKYLDGTAIPAAAWSSWVPTNIHPPPSSWKQSFDTQVDLNPTANGQTTVTVHREYRFETIPFTWTWGAPDPGNDHDRIE